MDAIRKIEEQLGKAKLTDFDSTQRLTSEILKILRHVRKETKFPNKKCFDLYLSYPVPPRLYGTLKAYQPEEILSHANYCLNC